MQNADPENRKILSMLCHGACLFSATIVSVGIPIAILVFTEDAVVKANAREALNFQITVFAAALVASVLIVVLIGFFLLGAIALFSIILPILAMVKVLDQPDSPYRYPLIFRIV